jgi:hypothetical protein
MPMTDPALKRDMRISVVIEWENARNVTAHRPRAMLAELRRQRYQLLRGSASTALSVEREFTARLDPALELIVVYDPCEVSERALSMLLCEVLGTECDWIQVRLLPCDDAQYYRVKNAGAQLATGALVIFLDSDVIPESDWLSSLVGAFADERVSVVAGNAYIEPCSVFSKAFALGWFFPLRTHSKALVEATGFFANNVAVRREYLGQFIFPQTPGTARGACTMLARTLRDSGVTIYMHGGAWVKHPPPYGLSNFIVHALVQGRDGVYIGQTIRHYEASHSAARGISITAAEQPGALTRLGRSLGRHAGMLSRIILRRSEVALSWAEVPVALGLMLFYFLVLYVGKALSLLFPGFMQRHFQI